MINFFYKSNISLKKHFFIKYIIYMIKNENFSIKNINFIFCKDNFLFKINKKFLKHNTYTDVITFNNNFKKKNKNIYGDIFISIDTVKYNAKKFHQKFINELKRVMIHGILHLMGYNDIYHHEIYLMRKKEDFYIKQWK